MTGRRIAAAILVIGALAASLHVTFKAMEAFEGDGYAGSESCRECHEREYGLWLTGPHTVHFRAATNEVAGSLWAIGRKDVIQYLRAMSGGRLQTMPWSWDIAKGEWYSTTKSMVRDWIPGDGPIDWRHEALTFNRACMGCHIAPSWQGYDPVKRTFSTSWKEPRISCEGCHGPLKRHCAMPHIFRASRLDDESCVACHVKLYGEAIERQSTDLPEYERRSRAAKDASNIVMLEDFDFTADGRDLGENYTITRWMMRPTAGRKDGPSCLTCHTSSGRTRFKGDANCTSCHSGKSAEVHGHHPIASKSRPTCVDCHMQKTSFARISHYDHSFRPPDPRLAVMHGGSSSCSQCHSRSEAENAEIVEKWFPASPRREKIRREASLIERARKDDPEVFTEAASYMVEKDANPVVVESLKRLL